MEEMEPGRDLVLSNRGGASRWWVYLDTMV